MGTRWYMKEGGFRFPGSWSERFLDGYVGILRAAAVMSILFCSSLCPAQGRGGGPPSLRGGPDYYPLGGIGAEGEVALTVQGNGGEPVEVERIAEGGFFGEVSALSRAPRNVTAVTTRPSELLELTRDYLEAVSIVHPRVWEVLEEFQKRRQVPVGV